MLSWLHTITRRSPNTARCNLILNKAPHRSSGVKFVHIQLQMLAPISVRWSVFTISMTNDHHDNAMVTDGGINHMGNKSPPRHPPPPPASLFPANKKSTVPVDANTAPFPSPPSAQFVNFKYAFNVLLVLLCLCLCLPTLAPPHTLFFSGYSHFPRFTHSSLK